MGNIFPLSEKPSCFKETLDLIEHSFGYEVPNRFEIDFAPLVDKSNHHNCFILLDENEKVIAHIGAKDRYLLIGNQKFCITMLGGIAVSESHRGEGHFQTLLQDVLAEKRDDTSFFVLWSDKEKLYKKFGFYLCGTQYEAEGLSMPNTFIKSKYHLLSPSEKVEIQNLYRNSFAQTYLTIEREEKDWKLIEEMISVDLYYQKSSEVISDYFFMNKGQDLPNIIFEYGSRDCLDEFIKKISHLGKVWTGKPIIETDIEQFQFFLSPGDLKLFSSFVQVYTQDQILIRNISPMKQEVYFDYNGELMALDTPDFLRGLFGPGTFEELNLPTLFISGLESI